ncbi:MAG: hypothetical protein ACK56R_00090, partial [Pirellulaceae bacterium]
TVLADSGVYMCSEYSAIPWFLGVWKLGGMDHPVVCVFHSGPVQSNRRRRIDWPELTRNNKAFS